MAELNHTTGGGGQPNENEFFVIVIPFGAPS